MRRFLLIFLLTLCSFPALRIAAQTSTYKLMHMGNREFRTKNYDNARKLYMEALKKDASNPRALFNLADTYLALKNPQAADSLYNIVTKTEKNRQIRSMAWHNRGYICQASALHDEKQQQQLLRQAIEHYKQALRLNPRDNDTRYNLALCQKQLKNSKDNQQQKKKEQEKKQQQQQEQKQQQKNNPKQPEKQKNPQNAQYINLAKQAERKALEKLKQQNPRQKSLDKNW